MFNIARCAKDVVDRALARFLRAYNAASSCQHRLPSELWYSIWGHLPLKDVLSVSGVCHIWHELAVGCPAL